MRNLKHGDRDSLGLFQQRPSQGWGSPEQIRDPRYAANKFFLYTMFGSAFMLVGLIATAVLHARASGGGITFDLVQIAEDQSIATNTARWLFLAFAVAFAIKVPVFPLHTWLPDAHTQAPTAGSVILAGVMLKLGTYGFVRFGLYLLPDASHFFAPVIATLGVIGILYGAVVATMQRDIKRLVAYSSVAHMGFIVLGIWAFTTTSLTGSIFSEVPAVTVEMVSLANESDAAFTLVTEPLTGRVLTYSDEIDVPEAIQHSAPYELVRRLRASICVLGPLLTHPEIGYVKGFYERPLDGAETGGGRVTELVARPVISLLFPHLASVVQPLSGEYGGRRDVLESVPFIRGYGVELGLLVDVTEQFGLTAVAQVDLGRRVHRNRGLHQLGPQAATILHAALQRTGVELPSDPVLVRPGSGPLPIETGELPPVADLIGRRDAAAHLLTGPRFRDRNVSRKTG